MASSTTLSMFLVTVSVTTLMIPFCHSSVTPDPTTSNDQCQHGFVSSYVHPQNCSRFFRCFDGRSEEDVCAAGKSFNVEWDACVMKESGLDICHSRTKRQAETDDNNFCVGENAEKNHAHPEVCSKYITCVDGKPEVKSCDEGKSYNENLDSCVLEGTQLDICNQNNDDATTTTTAPTTTTPTDQTTTTTTDPTTTTTAEATTTTATTAATPTIETTEAAAIAGNPCKDGNKKNYPYPEDCSKFILCFKGYPILDSCPEGKSYNEELNHCVIKGSELDICESDGEDDTDNRCPDGKDYYPHLYICSKFYECIRGFPIPNSCPEGKVFNEDRQECVPTGSELDTCTEKTTTTATTTTVTTTTTPETTTTELSTTTTTTDDGNELCRNKDHYAHPNDCSKFYVCVDGRPEENQCPDGKAYNENVNFCVLEGTALDICNGALGIGNNRDDNDDDDDDSSSSSSSSSDDDDSSSSNSSDDDDDSSNSNDDDDDSSNSNDEDDDSSNSNDDDDDSSNSDDDDNTNTNTNNRLCPKGDGRYAHPYDCSKFYECTNGQARLRCCGRGYVYNKYLDWCVYRGSRLDICTRRGYNRG